MFHIPLNLPTTSLLILGVNLRDPRNYKHYWTSSWNKSLISTTSSVVFLAARISYICFFTAVHIYDFHISTIINSWSVLWPIRTKECIKQATIGSRKWLNRSKWIQPRTARTTVPPFPIIFLPSFPFFSIFCSWRKIDLTLPERSPVPTKVTNPWFSSISSKFNGIQF